MSSCLSFLLVISQPFSFVYPCRPFYEVSLSFASLERIIPVAPSFPFFSSTQFIKKSFVSSRIIPVAPSFPFFSSTQFIKKSFVSSSIIYSYKKDVYSCILFCINRCIYIYTNIHVHVQIHMFIHDSERIYLSAVYIGIYINNYVFIFTSIFMFKNSYMYTWIRNNMYVYDRITYCLRAGNPNAL